MLPLMIEYDGRTTKVTGWLGLKAQVNGCHR